MRSRLFVLVAGFVAALLSVSLSDAQTTTTRKVNPRKKEQKKDDVIRLTGRLTTSDERDNVRGGCYRKAHELKLPAGKTYIIEMVDRNSFRNMDPYLRIEDMKGNRLRNEHGQYLEDDDGAGNLNSRLAFTPPKDDTYRIIATTCSSGSTGEYALTVTPVPIGTPLPPRGQMLTVMAPLEVGDLVITGHAPWGAPFSGNSNDMTHGYIEYRFTLENYSETETYKVALSIPRYRGTMYGNHLRTLRREVEVGPLGVVDMSLFQPDMPMPNSNDAELEINGKRHDLSVPIQVHNNRGQWMNRYGPRTHFGGPGSGSASLSMILSAAGLHQALDRNVFKSAVGVHEHQLPGTSSSTSGQYHHPGPYQGRRYVYSHTNRFHTVVQPPLNWSQHWLGYSSFDGIAIEGAQLDAAPAEVRQAIFEYVECGGGLVVTGDCKLPPGWERTRGESKYFEVLYPGFGQCVLTGSTPVDKWGPDEWREVTGAWTNGEKAWRQIGSATDAHRLFPVMDNLGIPVRGLFLVMIGFVVLIGPVNFYWLTRARRRIWLLWTVPAVSLFTCIVLFSYMFINDGWHGHVRATSITYLDETNQRAATVGWMGFYSPTFAAGGLLFSDDTELTPQLRVDRYGRRTSDPRTIDWTHGQHLDSGWIDAKIPLHFLVRRNEKRLERMLVRRGDDGAPVLVNGLPSDLTKLWLATTDGKVWTASDVRAGAEVRLQPAELTLTGKSDGLRDAFGKTWLESAKDIEKAPQNYLQPGCYLAVIAGQAPFLEQGIEHAQTRNYHSLVYGALKDPL